MHTQQQLEQSQTVSEAASIYASLLLTGAATDKQEYDGLTELYRRTLARLNATTSGAFVDVPGRDMRRWAHEQNIDVNRTGRVPLRVENAYRTAHGLPLREAVQRVFYDSNLHATAAQIRSWARRNGVPVGKRGRLHPTVLAAYESAMRGHVSQNVASALAAASVTASDAVAYFDVTPEF